MTLFHELSVLTLYLLALINPVSKISVLAVLSSSKERKELSAVVLKSSAAAACILFAAMIFGDFLLRSVFHVGLHSVKAAGGIVLCWVGFTALRKGVFFEQETHARFSDMAIVPLACPMIAGPAAIAASIAATARDGMGLPTLAMLIAVSLNALLMLFSVPIGGLLRRFNILGALIRITGLIVMTIGIEMAVDGLREGWTRPLPS